MHATSHSLRITSLWRKSSIQQNHYQFYASAACQITQITLHTLITMSSLDPLNLILIQIIARAYHRYQQPTQFTLTIKEQPETVDDAFTFFVFCQVNQLPIRATHIARETKKDVELDKVVQLLEEGRDLGRYGYKAPEANYMLVLGCLMFEHRVVIPPSLRQAILHDLHSAHVGIVKMKGSFFCLLAWY